MKFSFARPQLAIYISPKIQSLTFTRDSFRMKNIKEIASQLHISEDDLILYGKYKAKVPLKYIDPDKLRKEI